MVTLQLSAPKCFLKRRLTLKFISLEWHVLFLSTAPSFVNLLFRVLEVITETTMEGDLRLRAKRYWSDTKKSPVAVK